MSEEIKKIEEAVAGVLGKRKKTNYLAYSLLVIVVAIMAFNQYMIFSISGGIVAGGSNTGSSVTVSGSDIESIMAKVIPTGIPAVYGAELSVSFDEPIESLSIIGKLDRTIGLAGLSESQKQRYISIGMKSTCEYCCGAKSTVFENGQPACGCEHSAAFRGLSKYLLTEHENEYTDQQILAEIGKWKALFFPKDMILKGMALAQENNGVIDFAEMAGVLDKSKLKNVDEEVLKQLPGMVGGC